MALPADPFVLVQWSRCKVGPDIHVKVGRTLYSVPWKHIGQHLDARSTATMVQLFLGRDLVKTHVAKPQGKQSDLADYPPVMWNQRSVVKLMRRPGLAVLSDGVRLVTASPGSGSRRRPVGRGRVAAGGGCCR